ncbi:MAG: hypothetical protein AABZ74_12295 [Cyanobacteriota bacterium]
MELNFEFIAIFFIIIIFVIIISCIYFKLSKIKVSLFLILFILPIASFSLYLSLPNFISADFKRAKLASVKSNMHTFQTMLETYSVDENKHYPKNVEELENCAKNKSNWSGQYWKDFKSPFSEETGKGVSYDNYHGVLLKQNVDLSSIRISGCVYYSPVINKKGEVLKYFIYGSGKIGEIITDSQTNVPFTLSND